MKDRVFELEEKLDNGANDGYSVSETEILRFKYYEPVRVSMEVLERQKLHEEMTKSCRYCVASLLVPYHNRSCSLWVGVLKLINYNE